MNLERWALIAEVVGAVAIIATLFVLLLEVRTTNDLSRIASYEAIGRDFDEWRRDLISDPEGRELFRAYNRGELPPEGTDKYTKLHMILLNGWSVHERAYFSRDAEVLGDAEWGRVVRAMCREYEKASEHSGLLSELQSRFSDDFASFLESECGQH
jgi:hypothetical protein